MGLPSSSSASSRGGETARPPVSVARCHRPGRPPTAAAGEPRDDLAAGHERLGHARQRVGGALIREDPARVVVEKEELVRERREALLAAVPREVVRREMAGAADLSVPLDVSVGVVTTPRARVRLRPRRRRIAQQGASAWARECGLPSGPPYVTVSHAATPDVWSTAWKVNARTLHLEESARAHVVLQETERLEIGRDAHRRKSGR